MKAPYALSDLAADRRRRSRLLRLLNPRTGLRQVMDQVPRHFFLPDCVRAQAYEDSPLAIGCGQTISQPSLVLRMLELLDLAPGMRVLDVGSGSGYVSALLAHLLGAAGEVHAVELQAPLREQSQAVFAAYPWPRDVAEIIMHAAGEEAGYPAGAPYQRIHVGCAAQGAIPASLEAQLAGGGRMLIPCEEASGEQYLWLLCKDEQGQITRQ